MSEHINSAGGFLVPTGMAAFAVDAARAKSAMVQAGMRTVAMESETLKIAKVASDASFSEKTEGTSFTLSDLTFGVLTLTARVFGCYVKASRELLADSPNAAQVIEDALTNSLAVEIDRLALRGDGDAEPVGVANNADVQVIAVGGTLDYGHLLDAVEDVRNSNGEASAYITSPALATSLSKLLKNSEANNFAVAPADVATLRKFVTNQAASGELYLGDFTNAIMGLSLTPRIEIAADAGDSFKNHEVWLKCFWRGDIGVAHGDMIVKLTGAS